MLRWQELENGEWLLYNEFNKEIYRVDNEEQMTVLMDFSTSLEYYRMIDMKDATVLNCEGRQLRRRKMPYKGNNVFHWEVEW